MDPGFHAISPVNSARVICVISVKGGEVIRNDRVTASRDPFVHFVAKGSDLIVDDGAVCSLDVLAARHHNGFEGSVVGGE